MTARALLLLLAVTTFAPAAGAYTVKGGDLILRPVVGASINMIRLEAATRETPPGGMTVGVDLDYAITGEWNVTAALRPVVAPGFIDTQIGVGAKYRLVQTEAPLIPYASAMLTTALGLPLKHGDSHLNVGVRAALGADYFILRDLAVGAEIGSEASLLATPLLAFETTVDALLGLSWRF